jgi:hypothetical protein
MIPIFIFGSGKAEIYAVDLQQMRRQLRLAPLWARYNASNV